MQSSRYVVLLESGPTEAEPEVGRAPLQPCEAVQLLTFCEVHVRVALAPAATEVVFADSDSVGDCVGGGSDEVGGGAPPGGELACLFERGERDPYERISLARFRLR